MSFFGHGNPLASQVGQLIEQATDPNLASENWSLNMEICDVINETDDGPKDAVRAMKKRLQQFVGKNYNSVMYTLTILETCVKNCGKRFHIQVANKDFLHDLIKIIGPKNDPPQIVQEKVLSLIQTWADAFRGSPDLKEVEKVYQDLKAKGIEFPMTDLDNMAPIHTPARPQSQAAPGVPPMGVVPPQPRMNRAQGMGPVAPSPEQMSKLRRELDVVQGNYRVLAEMLTELSPTDVDQSNLELLEDLHRTCRHMQQRIVELLESVSNEEVTVELLRINDDMNNIFLRYERFDRRRTGQSGTTPGDQVSEEDATSTALHPPPPSYDQLQEAANPNVGNLIDLGPEQTGPAQAPVSTNDVQVGMAKMSIQNNSNANPGNRAEEADFDMFAQSRQSFDHSRQTLSGEGYKEQQADHYQGGLSKAVTAKTNKLSSNPELQVVDKASDYDEMESWLATNENKETDKEGGESITSSEFDRFLASRAAAVDQLPDIPAATGTQLPQRGGNRPTRQLQKEEEENTLFAL
ncbi:target of Myb1 membrane trafficking protein-like [Liolophura sinensis]|uniref:target of Myb1 membrane trafficking protein-like n=1 Tax=Liolophura sinensis TaxID=3198878 RepID=UPI00315931F7